MAEPMKPIFTILLLVVANIFMTLAWYLHLKLSDWSPFKKYGLLAIVLFSWGLALFEYLFQVPANKYGFKDNGGSFSLWQLKILQEIITIAVFAIFSLIVFRKKLLGTMLPPQLV